MNAALIGYARCSTDDQDLTAQVQVLERFGVTPDRILGEFDFSDEKLQDTTDVLPPPFHREARHLQVVEIVVKNFSKMGCDQGATTPSYWAGRLA